MSSLTTLKPSLDFIVVQFSNLFLMVNTSVCSVQEIFILEYSLLLTARSFMILLITFRTMNHLELNFMYV